MMHEDQGVMVNLAGAGIDRPFLGASGYGSSKTALMRMTDTLAFELGQAKCNIQVFGFDPGLVRTAMTENVIAQADAERWMPNMKKWLEGGKDHPAKESARALTKLLSIASPAISGRIF